jgi:hypothetical protein
MKTDESLAWEVFDTSRFIRTPQEWKWSETDDGADAAAEHHRVIFENDEVRILELWIFPGQKEQFHTHPRKSIMIIDAPINMRYYGPEGTVLFEKKADLNGKTSISWREPEGLHALENIDTKTFHAVRIEMKERAKS